MQCEVIDASLQRDNPAIQQLVRVDPLTPKVVDDQCPPVRFHLKRRFIEPDGLAVNQVHGVNGHLTADDHEGALDFGPTPIVAGQSFQRDELMVMQVENLDDLTIDFDGIGNPYLAALLAMQCGWNW